MREPIAQNNAQNDMPAEAANDILRRSNVERPRLRQATELFATVNARGARLGAQPTPRELERR